MVIVSSILITLALLFYSIGVWSERFTKFLLKRHLYFFWLGFAFDISGTLAMHKISSHPFNILEPHTLTGQIALWLMLLHAIWASIVIIENKVGLRKKFHKYSLLVWFIWLIPYLGGMYIGMSGK